MSSKAGLSARAKRRGAKEKLMKKATSRALTRKQKHEVDTLRRLPDERIDTTQIAEVTDWSGARRGLFYRPVKKQLTLRLDADVVEWFKTRKSGGSGYQTRINHALREYVKQHQGKRA